MSTQKTQVRRAFSRSADSYDATATVQREIAGRLLAVLPPLPKPRRALDAGCGTGHGLSLLKQRWPASELLALDFALPMLAKIQDDDAFNSQRCCADVEAMPFADASFDLLWSNLTLQWCEPSRFATEAARLLRPLGLLAVSTLGPGTFIELQRAFAGVDSYQHTTLFKHADDIDAAIVGAGLRRTVLHQETLIRHHPDLRSLLAEVRDIGASRGIGGGARRNGLLGKVTWRRFEDAIEAQRTPAGLPLTYETMLICAEK
jgi:malonyl-CoA O-methyltransferase